MPAKSQTVTKPPTSQKTHGNGHEGGVRWLWRHGSGVFGIIKVTKTGKGGKEIVTEYFVQVTSNLSAQLTKLEPDATICYTVIWGKNPHCGCDDFRRKHDVGPDGPSCKHVLAMRALRDRGQLI
jgi:hypothetical protein